MENGIYRLFVTPKDGGYKNCPIFPFLHLFTWKRCQLKIVDESSSADYSRQSVSRTYVHFPSQLEFSLIIMCEYRIASEKYCIDVPPNQNLTLSCLSFLILVFPFFLPPNVIQVWPRSSKLQQHLYFTPLLELNSRDVANTVQCTQHTVPL